MANLSLQTAKKKKNDEFYTRFDDIQKELNHYKDQFKGKVVYCNCDDPAESAFADYFKLNFNYLGLKKLICTRYAKSDLFTLLDPVKKFGYRLEVTGPNSLQKIELQSDGDFRSTECIELLKEADIVCTNPPFSLFRQYIDQLMQYNKKFLVIGPISAVTYKEVFPFIKDNKMWSGYTNPKEFTGPSGQIKKLGNVQWWTNLDVEKRHEELVLYETYAPEKYPKYVNYDAISVSKTVEIPKDYFEAIGVPISFLDKYNPDQFEIIGVSLMLGAPMSAFAPKGTFQQGGVRFYITNGDGTYKRLFDRLVIKRKVKNEHSS
jgi:hypothetical protein